MRGSGTTTEAIKGLKDGGCYIVHSYAFIGYCKDIAENIGVDIEIVPIDAIDKIRGKKYTSAAIDHFCVEEGLFDNNKNLPFILKN